MKTRNLILSLSSLCAAFALSGALAAGDGPRQLATALAHAAMAVAAPDTAGVHMHLHHMVNCLVGPGDEDYDAKAGDPCKGMGNGAVTDTDDSLLDKDDMGVALDSALTGLATDDYQEAHDAAVLAEQQLKDARK
jgi:hypothetical protein